jgi:hypothetical protein
VLQKIIGSGSTATPDDPVRSSNLTTPLAVDAFTFSDDYEASVEDLRFFLELAGTLHDDGTLTLESCPEGWPAARIFALTHNHPLTGHGGPKRTLERVRQLVSWPNMDADIADWCRRCVVCQKAKAAPGRSPVLSSTAVGQPFDTVYADHLGPQPACDLFKYALVIVDRFSRWCELVPVADTTADTTARAFYEAWVCRHGTPRFLITDGGSAFNNTLFAETCRVLSVEHKINVAHHPASHGAVERLNRTLLATLRTLLAAAPGSTWVKQLPSCAFALNTAVSRVTHLSPWEVLHGFPPPTPFSVAAGLRPEEAVDPELFSGQLVLHHADIATRVVEAERVAAAATLKAHTDLLRSRTPAYEVGQYALCRNFDPKSKLSLPWTGPYLVTELVGPSELRVQNLLNDEITKVHRDNTVPFLPPRAGGAPDLADALPEGEFFVENVLEVRLGADKRSWLRVKWLGYPQNPLDEWVCLGDCQSAPVVKRYINEHHLKFTRGNHTPSTRNPPIQPPQ